VTPLYGGAFGRSSSADRKKLYAEIPADTDVLITHEPPYGILDRSSASSPHTGCRELFEAVIRVRPKLHVFGHVHGAHGIFRTEHTTFANAALLGVEGDRVEFPIVFRMTRS
jgi:Icc-related predicted phosphoesterase